MWERNIARIDSSVLDTPLIFIIYGSSFCTWIRFGPVLGEHRTLNDLFLVLISPIESGNGWLVYWMGTAYIDCQWNRNRKTKYEIVSLQESRNWPEHVTYENIGFFGDPHDTSTKSWRATKTKSKKLKSRKQTWRTRPNKFTTKRKKQRINNNNNNEWNSEFLAKTRRPSAQRKRKRIFVFIETEIRSCNRSPLQRWFIRRRIIPFSVRRTGVLRVHGRCQTLAKHFHLGSFIVSTSNRTQRFFSVSQF